MRLLTKIKRHEMLRRWAIAEVFVEYLGAMNEVVPQQILELLYSGDLSKEQEGINRTLKPHHLSLVGCLPDDVSWYIGKLEVTVTEFNLLNTLPVPEFGEMTKHTYHVADAAKLLHNNQKLDLRINEIKQAVKIRKENVQWLGITLVASNVDGPFVIVEGNGRLISLYQILFLENSQHSFNGEIEVVIGITKKGFKIGYHYID